ncbi:MAG: hypothetical protein A2479_04395 [Candidatus Magasanikbacteria bacterium RIFOXYC2_FULL_39_8]|nr:MAG: hypothetical protein A2479_04395 [Candidatus Magasanikbacteria bacterium RIFOXYC2_FULL_39_8]
MGNFKRGGKPGGYHSEKSFGKRDFGGGRGFDRGAKREMFDAVCSECGDECQIPFRPTGGRPVLCSNCFGKKNGETSGKFGRNSFQRSDMGSKQMHKATCATCGDTCEVPFRPVGNKPVYCSQCFGKNDAGSRGKGGDQFKDQLNMLNTKLDKILGLLNHDVSINEVKEKKNKKEKKEEKVEKKVKKVLDEKKVVAKPAKTKEKKVTTKKVTKKKKA